jgi:hypothetical protein
MNGFCAKQKRSFHTVLSGLKFARYGKKDVRFLTLTTAVICKDQQGYEDGSLNKDFRILQKRISRYSPFKLWRDGYISKSQMTRKYGHSDLGKRFNFEYFKVETNEGNGVLHILYRGLYLPYNFLVDNWQDIHLSWDLNIKLVDTKDPVGSSLYIVSQYVGGQGSAYVRSSQSWKWLFRGFKSAWYDLKFQVFNSCFHNKVHNKYYRNREEVSPMGIAIDKWDKLLFYRARSFFMPQLTLLDYEIK